MANTIRSQMYFGPSPSIHSQLLTVHDLGRDESMNSEIQKGFDIWTIPSFQNKTQKGFSEIHVNSSHI